MNPVLLEGEKRSFSTHIWSRHSDQILSEKIDEYQNDTIASVRSEERILTAKIVHRDYLIRFRSDERSERMTRSARKGLELGTCGTSRDKETHV